MSITKVTLGRQIKVGLPQYSSNLISAFIEFEVKPDETFDFANGWKLVNSQIEEQATNKVDINKFKPQVNFDKLPDLNLNNDKKDEDLPF